MAATKEAEPATVSVAEDSSSDSDDLGEIGGSLLTQALGIFKGPVSKPGPKVAPRSAQVQQSRSSAAARSSQSHATGKAAGADAAVRVASAKVAAARDPTIAAGAGAAVQANAAPAPIIAADAGAAVRAASTEASATGEGAATKRKGRPSLACTKAAVALRDQVDRDISRIEILRANFTLDVLGDDSARSDRHLKTELNKKTNEVAQILATCAKASKKMERLPTREEDRSHALIDETIPLMEAAHRIIKVAQIHNTHTWCSGARHLYTYMSLYSYTHLYVYMRICAWCCRARRSPYL